MFCYKCGTSISDDSVFCPQCGIKVKEIIKEIQPTQDIQPKIEKNFLTIEEYLECHEEYLKSTNISKQSVLWDCIDTQDVELPAFNFMKNNQLYSVISHNGMFSYWYLGISEKGIYLYSNSFNVFMDYTEFKKAHKIIQYSDLYIGIYKLSAFLDGEKMKTLYNLLKQIEYQLKLN